jgi:hypothetical protein
MLKPRHSLGFFVCLLHHLKPQAIKNKGVRIIFGTQFLTPKEKRPKLKNLSP